MQKWDSKGKKVNTEHFKEQVITLDNETKSHGGPLGDVEQASDLPHSKSKKTGYSPTNSSPSLVKGCSHGH